MFKAIQSSKCVGIHTTYDHLHLWIKKTLIHVDITDKHHFQKVGTSGTSRTVKYLALCQILTHLIESSPQMANANVLTSENH